MGNKPSADTMKKIYWSMPSWTLDSYSVNGSTIKLVADSWTYAMSGEAPPYQLAKERDPTLTSLTFFYNNFYFYLFELIPECKPLFKRGIQAQGKMLANVIRFIVHNLNEANHGTFVASLTHLARVHNQRGIIAQWYDIMGLVLIHTMRLCTGTDYFTDQLKDAWIQVYSKMMAVIIPVVVRGELPDHEGDAVQNPEKKKSNLVYNYKEGVESDQSTHSKGKSGLGADKSRMTHITVKGKQSSAGHPIHRHDTDSSEMSKDVPTHYKAHEHSSPHVRNVHQEFSTTLTLQSPPNLTRDSPNNTITASVKPITHHEPKDGESNEASPEPVPQSTTDHSTPVSLFSGEKCPFTGHTNHRSINGTPVHPGLISPLVQLKDSPGSCPVGGDYSADVSPMPPLAGHPMSVNPEEKSHFGHGSHLPTAHTHKFRRLEKALIVAEAMEQELNICDRVFGFRKFEKCFIGAEAVDWMIANKYASDVVDAVSIGTVLCRARIIANVDNSLHFSNDLSYYQYLANRMYTSKPGEMDEEIRAFVLTDEQKKKKMEHEPVNYAALTVPMRTQTKTNGTHSPPAQHASSHARETGRPETPNQLEPAKV